MFFLKLFRKKMFLFKKEKEEKAFKKKEIKIWSGSVEQQPLWVFVRTMV